MGMIAYFFVLSLNGFPQIWQWLALRNSCSVSLFMIRGSSSERTSFMYSSSRSKLSKKCSTTFSSFYWRFRVVWISTHDLICITTGIKISLVHGARCLRVCGAWINFLNKGFKVIKKDERYSNFFVKVFKLQNVVFAFSMVFYFLIVKVFTIGCVVK